VYVGWPVGTEEVQKLGQPNTEGSITVYPIQGAKNATRYPGQYQVLTAPTVNLFAVVAHNTVTFSGVSDSVYNIHAFFGGKYVDARYQTSVSETLANVASGVASAINALAISGLTASASGAVVTLTGGQFQTVNIGSGNALLGIEEFRVERTIQVSVWINDAPTRWQIVEAIVNAIGNSNLHFLTLSDGSQAYIHYQSDYLDDSSESSYSLYAHHIWFGVEYGQINTSPAYQIESAGVTQTIDSTTPKTYYFGTS
jgi:hypothetical protein